ncbi:glycosyltransferase family 2 protein [Patescibacteria group bacterium]|nr:glycosyltransferase family 2 protein [Patescibacteria group bacterium]
MNKKLPSISIIIPTLNSERVIKPCLESIKMQNYPKDKIEVIIVDGGSTDKTIEICEYYQVEKILSNPLKTGEAGKAIGIDASSHDIIALIDSDNILDGKDWSLKMVKPFENPEIISSEVLFWTYRKEDSIINRYCALTGINDPICMFLGNYDRYNYLTGRWTDLILDEEIDRGDYLEVLINKNSVPTMGANGYLIKKWALESVKYQPYYFDIDVAHDLIQNGYNRIARPKVGIIHLYCDNLKTFIKKQKRRINDYLYFKQKGIRSYTYKLKSWGYIKFLVYTLIIFPLLIQSIKGYLKKPDIAWFFHPVACWITLWVYGWGTIKALFGRCSFNRDDWSQ